MLPLLLLVSILLPGTLGQGSNLNINIVCNTLVNQLDCSHFPVLNLCGTDGKTYKTECDYAKAHCTDRSLHVHRCNQGHTNPPGTNPPATNPPATNPPATHPPGTNPPATNPPVTTLTTTPMPDTTMAPSTVSTTWVPSGATLSLFCQTFLVQACPSVASPVCGSDGVTYNSFCEYQKRKCAVDSLQLLHNGACLPGEGIPTTTHAPLDAFEVLCNAIALVSCPDDPDPVCGSDSKTYSNPCDLEKAKCQNRDLVAMGLGSC